MIEPKRMEWGELSLEDSIEILREMQKRMKFYDRYFPFMGKEYCERLAGLESLAIDTVIAVLQNRG